MKINFKKQNLYRNFSDRKDFHVSKEDFRIISDDICYFCGEDTFSIIPKRINENEEYTLDNIVPCCEKCHGMILLLSVDEFLERVNKIYKNINIIKE
jgi:rRNA maturation protein Nop10